jgi:hypothetical protein
MARARFKAPACRVSLIFGQSRAAELDTPRLGCRKSGFGAVDDHTAFLLRHLGIDVGLMDVASPGTLSLPGAGQ